MEKKNHLKPLAAAFGTTFAVTLAAVPLANAADNPFAATNFAHGYQVADAHGEGKGGGAKEGEGKCGGKAEGEGKCGGKMESEGKCGGNAEGEGKGGEGKCGS